MFYVYILKSVKAHELYIGSSTDLRRRLEEHNSGKSQSTRRYMPWHLVYYEAFLHETAARAREHNLKYNGNAMRELKKRIGLADAGSPRTTLSVKKSGAGFTIIELLLVVAILGLILAIGIPSFASIRRNVALGNDADEIVSALRLAQSNAMASQGGQNQGVYFMADKYCLFAGTAPASCPAGPTTYTLGNYGITVNPAPVTVVFQRLTGATSAQSIVVQISASQKKTIQLDTSGKISLQ